MFAAEGWRSDRMAVQRAAAGVQHRLPIVAAQRGGSAWLAGERTLCGASLRSLAMGSWIPLLLGKPCPKHAADRDGGSAMLKERVNGC